MILAPTALLDFSKPFVLETNASNKDLGVVLMQEGRLITYLSKSLEIKSQEMSIYEIEMLPVIMVVSKRRDY